MTDTKTALLTSYSSAGFSLFPLEGKVPARGQKDWPNTPFELDPDPEKFPGNFGVVLRDDILVIDVDPRNFAPNDKPHKRLFDDIQTAFSAIKTFAVETGTGGLHIYFKIPTETSVAKHNKNYKGIDFLSRGCYVVGAGSIHPDTKKPYRVITGRPEDIKDAPAALIEIIRKAHKDVPHDTKKEYTNHKYDVKTFIELCKTCPPAVEGENGDVQTYKVAIQGRNLGLNPDITYTVMLEHYNPRCQPPWSQEDLKTKVQNAHKYGQGAIGQLKPEVAFNAVDMTDQIISWDMDEKSRRKKTINNIANYFRLEFFPLYKSIAVNEFSNRLIVLKKLPWEKPDRAFRPGCEWRDADTIHLKNWLAMKHKMEVQTKLIDEAVVVVGEENSFDPVRDYFTSLVWDGEPRLDTWLTTYCGVKDTPYVREAGKIFLCQMIKRVYQPGCKADYVLILEGPQGIGKSTVFQIIGGEWFADFVIDPHATNTVDAMQGKILIELSEMDVVKKAEVTALKAFITRQSDRVRLAYARRTVDLPRKCVFAGTMNPDATNEYLADTTGNRRFMPVKVGELALADLEMDRTQLLAEAVQAVMRGTALYIESKDIQKEAEQEQKKRQFSDPWVGIIEEFLDTDEIAEKYHFTTAKDIWASPFGLKGSASALTRFQSSRIHTCMRELGWEYGTHRHPISKKTMKSFVASPHVKIQREDERLKERKKENNIEAE